VRAIFNDRKCTSASDEENEWCVTAVGRECQNKRNVIL
jgi:hypothetical protein